MPSPFAGKSLLRLALATLLASAPGCAHPTPPPPSESPPSAAPTVLDLNGQPVDLFARDPHSLAPNPITVVLFTRTDCPISNRYAPEVRRLYTRYHPMGVNFYLIYVDPTESTPLIRRHLEEYQYRLIALRDPTHALVAYCQATVTPEAAVFDRTDAHTMTYLGRITDQYAALGQARPTASTHDLEDAISATLAHRPLPTPRTRAIGCTIADLTTPDPKTP